MQITIEDSIEQSEVEAINNQLIKIELNHYCEMADSISKMFDESSKEAAAFREVKNALAMFCELFVSMRE